MGGSGPGSSPLRSSRELRRSGGARQGTSEVLSAVVLAVENAAARRLLFDFERRGPAVASSRSSARRAARWRRKEHRSWAGGVNRSSTRGPNCRKVVRRRPAARGGNSVIRRSALRSLTGERTRDPGGSAGCTCRSVGCRSRCAASSSSRTRSAARRAESRRGSTARGARFPWLDEGSFDRGGRMGAGRDRANVKVNAK